MINLKDVTDEDLEKIKLIESVFNTLTVDEIKKILSNDLVVAKLQGKPNKTGFMTTMITDNFQQHNEIQRLSSELINVKSMAFDLRSDISSIIKILKESLFRDRYDTTYNDFDNLKRKHNVY